MRRADILILLAASTVFTCLGCGKIEGPNFPYVASPRVIVHTPASPAEGDIATSFQLIDRELETGSVTLEYSTDNGQTFSPCTLVDPAEATGLDSAWHPGKAHSVRWDSVADNLALSGDVTVCVKVTPSDASNPSGTAGVSGAFTVNNTAYNQPPTATTATPGGVQFGNIPINYFLADVESDTCSIIVQYSPDDGANWSTATMGAAGEGLTGLSSSPGGTAHTFLWDSRADNVAPASQLDTVKVRITPTDFHVGTAGETNSFSVDNSITNDPPTVTITGGPAEGSTVSTDQVTFNWSGSDTDGSVIGYYYSFDHDPPDIWTTDTSVTSDVLSEGSHTFRVVAVDDQYDLSAVASRTFTVSLGVIAAGFIASPTSGDAPLTVYFTDQSSATNGIDTWSWNFGNGDTSTAQDPSCIYNSAGTFTVSLTVTGPDGSDTETKTAYITVTSPSAGTIYVDGAGGLDSNDGLSWPTAVEHIQTGLDKAADNWTVLVADGTYTGTSNKNLDFGGKAVHLKSAGGVGNCIIDCEDDGRGFYFHNGETNATIVDGFTIQKGNVGDENGGGILCASYPNESSPTITHCIVKANRALIGAGIALMTNTEADVLSCVITGNFATDNGCAVFCYRASADIVSCVIEGNSGGGILCSERGMNIHNCLIADNSTNTNGAGVLIQMCSPTISNCTITNNVAALNGAGLYCNHNYTEPVLNNTILWGNQAGQFGNEVYTNTYDAVTMKNCCFADNALDPNNIAGIGSVIEEGVCIHLGPEFVNATAQDYHLQSGSPCIDAGDNSLVPPGVTTDLDGKLRILNSLVDIGAYEFASTLPEPVYGWTRRIGGGGYDRANAVCTDTGGNLYVAGYFNGTVNFAEDWGGTDEKTTNVGSLGLFITKVAANGDYAWTHVMDRPSTDQVNAMCADADGNVYLTGFFSGNANFAVDWGGTDIKNSAGFYDIFVTKIDSNGSYCWTHRMGGPDFDVGHAICADGVGNVYVAGYFSDTVNFADDWGGTDEKTSSGSAEAFVTKIDAGGSYCWTYGFGATEADTAWALCADNSNVYVAGTFHGTVNFAQDWGGSDTKTSAGLRDMFITKLSAAGSYVWTRRTGGVGEDYPLAICADTGSNVYVTGCFMDSVDFAEDWGTSDTKTSPGSYDVFITKINSGTGYGWTHRMGSAESAIGRAIWADASGGIYVAGAFCSTVNFAEDWGGTDTKTSAGSTQADVFVTKMNANGSYSWTRRMGGTDKDDAQSLCVDASGNIYVAGFFMGSANFAEDWGGSDTKTSTEDSDIFVTKITQP